MLDGDQQAMRPVAQREPDASFRARDGLAIENGVRYAAAAPRWRLHPDLVAGAAECHRGLESRPVRRNAGVDQQVIAFACGSPGCPRGRRDTSSRPSRCTRSSRRARRAARRNRRRRRRHRARPCSAATPARVRAWLIGLSMREQLARPCRRRRASAKAMTAQIAAWVYWPPFSRNAGRIALDVAGIERRLVEGRREQQRQAVVAADRDARRRAAIACAARARIGRARDHGPGLRDRVDAAFVARAPSRAACRRRSSRGDTSRRPRPRARAPRAARPRAPASARRAPRRRAPRASGANAASVA